MLYNPGRNISVNEAVMKFKGRSMLKQFQPLYRADSTNGYIDNFVVYTGKSDDGPTSHLGYKVVVEVCKDILGKDIMSIVTISLQVFIWKQTYWNMGPIL